MIDTIAAISTAHGSGAIGVIRISGMKVLEICSSLLQKKDKALSQEEISKKSRQAIFCDFHDGTHKIDQILFLFFKGPASYTGEDMAEFHFHGNPILLSTALEVVFHHGARPALQGEFSKRAFLNGKMDLAGTEAIARLIHSRSRFELELAQKNVFGELSRLSSLVRSELLNLKAECEAEIDFSTEDLTFESITKRKSRINHLIHLCNDVLNKSARAEQIISQQKIVLYGQPNTGKSSILNRLIGRERAIISETPGTTRDYISEEITIAGIPVQIVDTAGVRHTEDEIEKRGIELSKNEFKNANLKLFIVDSSLPFHIEDFLQEYSQQVPNLILVANKIDIKHNSWSLTKIQEAIPDLEVREISCKTGYGIEELLQFIGKKLKTEEETDEYVLLEERNRYHFQKIKEHLYRTIQLMEEGAYAEIYIKEIDDALEQVGFINGKIHTEEILGRIFSRFCVGK